MVEPKKYAIVHRTTKVVHNIIVWDGQTPLPLGPDFETQLCDESFDWSRYDPMKLLVITTPPPQ